MSTTRFISEFKDQAVRQITEQGYSIAEVSARFDVPAQCLCKWVHDLKLDKTGQQAYDFTAAKDAFLKKTACYFARELE